MYNGLKNTPFRPKNHANLQLFRIYYQAEFTLIYILIVFLEKY